MAMNVSFRDIIKSYNSSGEAVVGELGDWSKDRFTQMEQSGCATPVLITAFDEEDDITTTLASLARQSRPVRPVVVDNSSTDRTVEFALAMGADVTFEPAQTKIRALITGLRHVSDHYEPGSILLTDADTAFGANWANLMTVHIGLPEVDIATQIGTAFYHNTGDEQGNIAVDTVRSIRSIIQAAQFKDRRRGRGHNMNLWFANTTITNQFIDTLSPECITRNDTHLAEQVIALGGVAKACLDPRAVAFTRGDRMPDWSTFFKSVVSREFRTVCSYSDWFERATLIEFESKKAKTSA